MDIIFQFGLSNITVVSGGHDYISSRYFSVGTPYLNFLPFNINDERPDINIVVENGSITRVDFSGGGFLNTPEIVVTNQKATSSEMLAYNLYAFDRQQTSIRIKEAIKQYISTEVIYSEVIPFIENIDSEIEIIENS